MLPGVLPSLLSPSIDAVAGAILLWTFILLSVSGPIQAQTPDAGIAQAASIARQMDAIAQNAAEQQLTSIRTQAEAIRRQKMPAPANLASIAQNAAAPLAAAPSKTIAEPLEPEPLEPGRIASVSGAPDTVRGFYTTPWPGSPDFRMPNVQVDAVACDALSATEADTLIAEASRKNQVEASLLRAVMLQESGMRPCAVSTAGAMGLMQIMPGTADDLGLSDPFDPAANVDAGARYLKMLLDRYRGSRPLALAAYNAGLGRTDKANGIPQIPETIGYVSNILANIPLF